MKPKVIVNCAMSADGKIALPDKSEIKISGEEDFERVHNLRNSVDAILVGIGTVLADDPKLTVKEKYVHDPHQPIRIVLDTHLRTPENALIVNDKAKTIIVKDEQQPYSKKYLDTVTVLSVPSKKGMLNLEKTVQALSKQGINTLLVEGGGTVIWNFITHGLVDDLFVYIGSMIIGGKQTPTMAMGQGFEHEDDLIRLQHIETKKIGDGLLLHYQLR